MLAILFLLIIALFVGMTITYVIGKRKNTPHLQAHLVLVSGSTLTVSGAMLLMLMPSLLPLIFIIPGLFFLGLGFWSKSATQESSWFKQNVASWGLPLIAVGILALFVGLMGIQSHVTHVMIWSVGNPPQDRYSSENITFRFKDYPGHYVEIGSNEVASYLKTLPSNEVEVEFRVTREFGRIRGINEVRIGTLTQWDSTSGSSGSSGSGGDEKKASKGSPWD